MGGRLLLMKNFFNQQPMTYTAPFRPPKTKICNACKIEKPLKDFHKNPESRDGRHNKCKDCYKEVEDKKKAELAEYGKNISRFKITS